jgi:hypothetical protein
MTKKQAIAKIEAALLEILNSGKSMDRAERICSISSELWRAAGLRTKSERFDHIVEFDWAIEQTL